MSWRDYSYSHLWHNFISSSFSAPVSKPDLSVASQLSEVVLGKNFTLRCYSKHGTPPITYTLYRTDTLFDTVVVHINASAEFRDVAISRHVQGEYKCEAKNGHSLKQQSSGLNISVIGKCFRKKIRALRNSKSF